MGCGAASICSFAGTHLWSCPLKLTVKSDYATRAVLGLARAYDSGKAVRVDDLASRNGVSANYLVQILIELKARGIVKSVRGKDGGYLLARSPGEISFGEVLRIVHGEVFDTPALSDDNCPTELREAWSKLQVATTDAADAINFQSLLERSSGKEEMYYI
ncbi:MAG: Rrf2 family protein [Limisphaerales bacterium]|jgi:Rrf2 family protein